MEIKTEKATNGNDTGRVRYTADMVMKDRFYRVPKFLHAGEFNALITTRECCTRYYSTAMS